MNDMQLYAACNAPIRDETKILMDNKCRGTLE